MDEIIYHAEIIAPQELGFAVWIKITKRITQPIVIGWSKKSYGVAGEEATENRRVPAGAVIV